MKLSLKITEAKGSQQCDAASLFGGFWKAKTLMDMHHYVWVKKLITRALRDGAVPSTGTAITNIIQPTSRFSGGGELDEYKERVFNKLSAFVERFFRLSSGKEV